jgi:hypothetical protein
LVRVPSVALLYVVDPQAEPAPPPRVSDPALDRKVMGSVSVDEPPPPPPPYCVLVPVMLDAYPAPPFVPCSIELTAHPPVEFGLLPPVPADDDPSLPFPLDVPAAAKE